MVRTRVLAGAAHEISSDQQRGSPAHALLMLKVTRRAQLRVPSLALVPALSVQQASATCGFHRRSQGPFIPSPAHSLTHSPRLVHDSNSSLQRVGLRHWENWASGQSGPERLGEPGHWGLKGQGHSGPLQWCTSVFLPVKWSCLRGKGVRLEEQKCQHCAVPDRGAAATMGLGLPHGDGRGCWLGAGGLWLCRHSLLHQPPSPSSACSVEARSTQRGSDRQTCSPGLPISPRLSNHFPRHCWGPLGRGWGQVTGRLAPLALGLQGPIGWCPEWERTQQEGTHSRNGTQRGQPPRSRQAIRSSAIGCRGCFQVHRRVRVEGVHPTQSR